MRSQGTLRPVAAGIVAVAALFAGAAPPVEAQMVFTATRSIGGPGEDSPISAASVRRYSELLGLDESQRELIEALHEGYSAAAAEVAEEFQDAILGARQAFEDTGDGSVFMEVMPEAREKRSKSLEGLEKQFFDDLAMILTPAQAELRPRLERLRRREVQLPNGALSGETVDLVELIDSFDLPDGARESLEDTILLYEVELDRALASRTKVQEEGREDMNLGDGGNFQFDVEKMQEVAAENREASLVVKGVNDRYARILASELPEQYREDFKRSFHKKSFPQVYRTSSIQEALDAAQSFADLTSEQRQAIEDLLSAHERDVETANRRWAKAIEESEADEESGAMAFGPGMMVRMGEEDSSPVGEARSARREIDQRTREKLLAALTEDQRERLPKRREREGQWSPGSAGIIGHQMVIEIDEVDGGG